MAIDVSQYFTQPQQPQVSPADSGNSNDDPNNVAQFFKPSQPQQPQQTTPSNSGVDVSKYFSTGGAAPTAKPTAQKQPSILDSLFQSQVAGPEKFGLGATKLAVNTGVDILKNLRDAFSGKDLAKAEIPATNYLDKLAGNVSKTVYENAGKYLYTPAEQKQNEEDLSKNPDTLSRIGAFVNVLSAPFVAKDIVTGLATGVAKAIGKEIPMPAMVDSVFSTVNHTIPDTMVSGMGKVVQETFGKFDSSVLANHLNVAKDVFPGITIKDLQSQEGQHVVDWVMKYANQLHFAQGGDEVRPLSTTNLEEAWADVKNIWGATSIKDASMKMDSFAKNMDRVVGGIQDMAGKLGIDDSFVRDATLYTPDYMQARKALATKMGEASPSLTDYLESVKDSILKQPVTTETKEIPDVIDNMVKSIKLVEKDTGYKVGAGHQSFINPTLFSDAKALPEEIAAKAGQAVKAAPIQKVADIFKSAIDPQVYTGTAKEALTQARFRMALEKRGLDPLSVLDKLYSASAKGKVSLFDRGVSSLIPGFDTKKYAQIFGDDAAKVLDAADEAGKLPLKVTGLSTSAIARRIPGASPLTQALFGLRWRNNPLFLFTKVPTKIFEIAAASGVAGSKEASDAVTHYMQTMGRPMVGRLIDEADMISRSSSKPFGELSQFAKDFVKNSEDSNVVKKSVANSMDWLMNADEKAYTKAVYKKLGDYGYDLSTVPYEKQLDFVRKIPQNILGVADNFAKTLTKYGTGTSPLQNTLNTIWFPMLFHLKVAKFAAIGALKYPAMTDAIVQLVNEQGKWALSPEGQQWHQTPGVAQSILHLAGAAEPVNIPALTGKTETLQQTEQRFNQVYNPLSGLLQGARDVTGNKNIPFTQPPKSESEIKHPIAGAVANLTGYGSVFSQAQSLGEALGVLKAPATPSLKTVKNDLNRQAKGLLPKTSSLLASLRNFAGNQQLSQTKKMEYAQMRANYDFPNDTTKQNKEIDTIMRLWKRVRIKP